MHSKLLEIHYMDKISFELLLLYLFWDNSRETLHMDRLGSFHSVDLGIVPWIQKQKRSILGRGAEKWLT